MCARRFLLVIFWLTLIFVAAAFAIYQFGQQVLIKGATPKGHFQNPSSGRPDYSRFENWLARPEISGQNNPSLWRPSNWPPPTLQKRFAKVFYIHPTTYLQRDRWNAPLDGDSESMSR